MKKILALLATAATVSGALAATPVQADPGSTAVTITSVRLSATDLVLDGDSGCGDRVRATITLHDPAGRAESADIDALVYDGGGAAIDWLAVERVSRTGDSTVFAGTAQLCPSLERPGRYRIAVEVTSVDDATNSWQVSVAEAHVTVRRPTSLSYNAAPEPVRKGRYLTHRGRLMFDRYGHGDHYGARSTAVKLYFRRDGASVYAYQGTATTDDKGRYAKKIKASSSGVWKAVYAGSGTRQAQTRWDRVQVRR